MSGIIFHVLLDGNVSYEFSLSQDYRGMLPSSSIALVEKHVSRDAKHSYLKRQGSPLQPTVVYRRLAVLHFHRAVQVAWTVSLSCYSQYIQCLH